jgi:FkbM family methyltransferase
MPSLAMSPLAPVLGQRVPLRGPARLLYSSYVRTRHQPGRSVTRPTTVTGDQFDVDLSSFLEWQLWAFGGYERHFAELFSCLVSPGDRCVDVGANIGVHTVRLAKLAGPSGSVIAIEPDPDVAGRARRNIALNGLGNARVINAAASDQAGETVLYRPGATDTNRARASLLRHSYLTGAAITVPVITVDSACADSVCAGRAGDDAVQGARVAVIKIDVEGLEAAVVRGAARVIDRDAPAVIFEYAPQLLDDASQTPFSWLAERGYEMFRARCARHGLTGRGRLVLEPLPARPAAGGDIVAVPAAMAGRLSGVIG